MGRTFSDPVFRDTGACTAINSMIESLNTRSFALTWRFGGNALDIGIGSSRQSSNSVSS